MPDSASQKNAESTSHPSPQRPLWAPWRIDYIRSERSEDGCVFCRAAAADSDRDRLVIARAKSCFVIMNRFPYTSGHLMVCPYRHVDDLNALSLDELTEMMACTQKSLAVLRECMSPQGFNVGFNLGSAAGAGIADHMHLHIVPRWSGDTNFMPVLAHTRVMPESLDQTWELLTARWKEQPDR
jgi:ATP adenylyltransferase